MEPNTIRVPYRNLRQSTAAELELIEIDGQDHPNPNEGSSDQSRRSVTRQHNNNNNNIGMGKLVLSCAVAAGVQFGWALQLSLLTPYIQVSGAINALRNMEEDDHLFFLDQS